MKIRDTSKNAIYGLSGSMRYRTDRKGRIILQVETWDSDEGLEYASMSWRDARLSDFDLEIGKMKITEEEQE